MGRDFGRELQRAGISGDGIVWDDHGPTFREDVDAERRAAVLTLWQIGRPSLWERVKGWLWA